MNLNRIWYLVLFILLYFPGVAQDPAPVKSFAKYDPLFWKDQLKLRANQSQRIREINFEFYEQLMSAFYKDRNNKPVMQSKVNQSLMLRSQQIWETLYRKQRKKWGRIMRESSKS